VLKNLNVILTEQAPDLLARTELPRNDPLYLTQRQAFNIHRKKRLDDLATHAPDLFERLSLPNDHPDRLGTPRAYAIWRARKNRR
jgi:hypothetical protein